MRPITIVAALALPTALLVQVASTDVPGCKDVDLSKVVAGTKLTACDGTTVEGTYVPEADTCGLANLRPENIRSGININGVVGTLAASPDDCSSTLSTSCVPTSTYKSVSVSGMTNISTLGSTLGGVAGSFKNNCRNAGVSATYNANSLPLNTAATAGGTIDWWDTIWDSYTTLPTEAPSWGVSYNCDGGDLQLIGKFGDATRTPPTHLTPTNANIVCVDGDNGVGGPGVCAADNFTEVWYDSTSELYFTNVFDDANDKNWSESVSICYNLDSGDGTNKWRLPSQKDLVQLYINGIRAIDGPIDGSLNTNMWSSTSIHLLTTFAFNVSLFTGNSISSSKTSNRHMICVRP